MNAQEAMKHGAAFPYDGGDEFWDSDASNPPAAKDKAHATARGILADLSDRRGVSHELDAVDHDVRAELTESLVEIIRYGMA